MLELANRLVPEARRRREDAARDARRTGRSPSCAPCDGRGAPSSSSGSARSTSPYEEVAILCRTNARLVDFEEALHEAGIPAQGASFLGRESARFVLRRLASPADVRRLAEERGWLENPPDKLGEREVVRQTRPRRGSSGSPRSSRDLDGPGFVAELERRFGDGGEARRGVHLLTLHGAKGLEFEAVFVARVEEKELPTRLAKTDGRDRGGAAPLLRRPHAGEAAPVRDVDADAVAASCASSGSVARPAPRGARPSRTIPIFAALKRWRLERARADEVPAYVVFHNSTLAEIAGRKPQTLGELAAVPGVGPAKLERYGDDVLGALVQRRSTGRLIQAQQ